MSDAARQLADDDPNDAETWAGTVVVTDPDAGTALDGRRLIAVDWLGTEIRCTYLDSYTPGAGDRVAFIKAGPSFLVLGRPATT